MSKNAVQTGWRRFLDKLKELWGKSSNGGLATAIAHGWKFGKAKAVRLRVGS
jgi:hypothetical protein